MSIEEAIAERDAERATIDRECAAHEETRQALYATRRDLAAERTAHEATRAGRDSDRVRIGALNYALDVAERERDRLAGEVAVLRERVGNIIATVDAADLAYLVRLADSDDGLDDVQRGYIVKLFGPMVKAVAAFAALAAAKEPQ